MSHRIKRVNELIKRELSQILLREADFPGNILITLTRVEISVDLKMARVYISVLPKEEGLKILRTLNRLAYFLQKKLNKRLKMRPLPKIKFLEEEKTEEAAKIEKLLEEVKKDER